MKLATLAIWLTGALALGIGIWTVGSAYVVWGIEEAKYTVVEEKPGYEIRRYEPMLVAETAMAAPAREGESNAFRILARYIFGGNRAAQKIDMTTPVIMEGRSQKIAMTAPVIVGENDTGERMAFVLPSEFTMDTLPVPEDSRVEIREVPVRFIAAVRFSWYAPENRRKEKSEDLLRMLSRDGIVIVGVPFYAGYNPPFSVPFLKRHEMLVEVEAQS